MIYVGFDIGGTKCAVSVGETVQDGLTIHDRREFPTPARWQDALDGLFALADDMTRGCTIDACGFSCGGPLDAQKGLVLSPPNLPSWDHVPVTKLAEAHFHVPCFLENDANACALAEWRWGAGQGVSNMAFLTFGTGLGAGLILDDRLIRGANGNAGELGHIRLSAFGPSGYGKEGSFEGFCSGGGIAQLAVTLGKRSVQKGITPLYYRGSWDNVTTKEVALAAQTGDETAREIFDLCGEKLGEGLAVLIDLINPERIVIGSIFRRCEDLLRPAMEKALTREALGASLSAASVVPARLGERIGDYAALCVADYGLSGK